MLFCHPSSTRSLRSSYIPIIMRYRGYRRSAAMRTDLRFFRLTPSRVFPFFSVDNNIICILHDSNATRYKLPT